MSGMTGLFKLALEAISFLNCKPWSLWLTLSKGLCCVLLIACGSPFKHFGWFYRDTLTYFILFFHFALFFLFVSLFILLRVSLSLPSETILKFYSLMYILKSLIIISALYFLSPLKLKREIYAYFSHVRNRMLHIYFFVSLSFYMLVMVLSKVEEMKEKKQNEEYGCYNQK